MGRVLPSVSTPPYGAPVPANDHVRLVSTAGWEERAGAVAARTPVLCLVQAEFADGYTAEVRATASAWSEQAVHVFFSHPDPAVHGPAYRVWVPLSCVRRLPAAA